MRKYLDVCLFHYLVSCSDASDVAECDRYKRETSVTSPTVFPPSLSVQ